jgi:hypothetical protein
MQSLSRQTQQCHKVRRGWGDTTGKDNRDNCGGGRCSFQHYHLLPKSTVDRRKKFGPMRSTQQQQGWQGTVRPCIEWWRMGDDDLMLSLQEYFGCMNGGGGEPVSRGTTGKMLGNKCH